MTDSINRIPEPVLPEHQLLREASQMPQLSSGLRARVVMDVHRQVRYGRWADRLRIAAVVLAASLMVCLVWHFRWTGQEQVAEQKPDVQIAPPMMPVSPSSTYSSSQSPELPVQPAVPQGGPSSRPEMREMQQINRLIEEIQSRDNLLFGLLPIF